MRKIGIIGAGVVGTAVGVILSSKGYEITGVCDINPESTKYLAERTGALICRTPQDVARSSEILFITTSDGVIGDIVNAVARAESFAREQLIVHMSGALTSDVLAPAKMFGAFTVSIHPMQSFAGVEQAVQNLPGSVFSIEGDQEAHGLASKLVEDLDGDYFVIDKKDKPLYHAGACVVSNYLVTLIDVGLQLLESTGIPRQKALKAFVPLINGTLSNIEKIGIPKALTGPIARGDILTVLKHLDSMSETAPELKKIYSWLGYYTADVAAAKGTIDQAAMDKFKQMFLRELAGRKRARAGGE
ncbi:MAG: Rossmann-like and DUF2520 domain-containing protein [Candidatus Saccharibacteria bacterium]